MTIKIQFTSFKYLFCSRDTQVFKIIKLAKKWHHTLNHILINYNEKNVSANLYQKCLILCSKILLNVPHNMSSTVLLPWQHARFQTSLILRASLATFVVPFWYLLMVPNTHNSVSIYMRQLKFVASFNVLSNWKLVTYWNQVGGHWKRVSCHGNIIFYSCSSVSCRNNSSPHFNAANWPR